ncbi:MULTISPECIES: hypothetical protein [unclassified Bradyrhizobium]|uniref:hypothetical protein n=1 Tax=unclassified Bradyrhizobium TaxID=2631580 RepID=UPI001FF84462|nr:MULTISPECIES: hypothetical protein [unclassified Bradyrhizobium]MCK1709078.1 hypothetical protein [Bradyrhizobium sp. 143]MCK1724022.1 hypothetical protein [Bradyrhizobium sp. 142]
MASTENTAPKSHEDDPIKVLFDVASYWATIWSFIALCLWLEHQVLNRLDIESDSIRVAVLLVSTPAIFLATVTRIDKYPKARLILERARYIVILVAAALLGAYLHANHKDDSYENALRDGAVLACSKMAACKAAATEYANMR